MTVSLPLVHSARGTRWQAIVFVLTVFGLARGGWYWTKIQA